MVGFVAKGSIYVVIGILTLLAALDMGGKSSGTNQAIEFLEKQVFGKIVLVVLALGLFCYAVWMAIQCFKDPENVGSDKKALLRRTGFLLTGLIYFGLGLLTFSHIINLSSGSGGKSYLNKISPDVLSVLFSAFGVIMLIQAVIILIIASKGTFIQKFHLKKHRFFKLVKRLGYFGFFSRALILGLIGFLFLRAGIYSGSHDIKGMKDAFSFLESWKFGSILMAAAALGFIAYGLFFIFLSKYRTFKG